MKKSGRSNDYPAGSCNAFRQAITNRVRLFSKGKAGLAVMALPLSSSFMNGKEYSPLALARLGCEECHVNLTTAAKDINLHELPGLSAIDPHSLYSLAKAPDSFLMTGSAEGCGAVSFEYGSHARMAEMGDTRTKYQHYRPAKAIVPCDKCRGPESRSVGLSRTDLEEACHHICLGYLQEWDRKTKCDAFHNVTGNGSRALSEPENSPILVSPESSRAKQPAGRGTSALR